MTESNLESGVPEDVPLLVKGKTWEEMPLGWSFRTAARSITEADLINFITMFGFIEPLFWDESSAESMGYRGRLVPGALTYAMAEGLVLQSGVIHGTGIAFLGMDLEIHAPVFVGDTLDAVVVVTEARPSSKHGRGIVRTEVSVRNQDRSNVLTYRPLRLIKGAGEAE